MFRSAVLVTCRKMIFLKLFTRAMYVLLYVLHIIAFVLYQQL
jgi:hypothetical protein